MRSRSGGDRTDRWSRGCPPSPRRARSARPDARPSGRSGGDGRGFGGGSRGQGAAPPRAPLEPRPGEEVVDGEALVLAPRARRAADGLLAPRPRAAVEVLEGPADSQVARRADVAPAEAAGEEPVRGPPTEPALAREPLDHDLARRRRERVEVEAAREDSPREVADVLALAVRELHHAELPQPRPRERRRVAGAGDTHHQTRVVHRARGTDLVGHQSPVAPEHTQERAIRETVRGIFSPQMVARERRAGVERTVRSEDDVHRVVTRPSSVPELPHRSASAEAAGRPTPEASLSESTQSILGEDS